ncbi:hypothetical protein BOO86_08785 [Mycobacterium sp. CBMA 234]|uniref:aldehyde dehydrogenase family protein n=1 Tax=Mycolicibacterium sp. CBMA 234 TaxID=1918495 RepID=UPI001391D4B2|nr:aldehyde dehydrogenase family protein [Mycolicibacterium sp. CBMA 234]MUL64554.1 hypothetical protein [Mycolicibacterium sp. CBMA 234]
MLITEELFVGGEWTIGTSRKWLDVVSPSTEKPMGRIVIPTYRELDRAVQAARTAFDDGPWPRLPIEERAAYLRAALKIFEDKYLQTAIAMQVNETGAPISFTRATTTAMPALLDRLIRDAREVVPSEIRQGITGHVKVMREPLGVVAAIVPWNAPILAAAAKLFPALLMGCPTVLKTSPQAPFSAYLLAQALGDSGIPPGVVSILPGGSDVGSYLISHPQVDAVTFIGSTETGRKIASVCGQQLKSVTCELGGKSAAILTEGADIERHLPAVLAHSLTHNGQLHIATSRLLVHTSQTNEFADALIGAVAAMPIGDPHDRNTAIGPLVSDQQRNRVEGYVASGQAQGARLLYGGTRPEHLPVGYYLRPAIFGGVKNDMAIARDEIFGPVLSIIGYRDEAEAVRLANDSAYGLGGSVYSDDADHALELAGQLQTGTCAVNNAFFAGDGGPYDGAKASGLGRDGGPDGLHRYLRVKSIALPASWSIGLS